MASRSRSSSSTAARSIRVLNRHKDAAPAVGAYVGSLDTSAQAFVAAFDQVHSSSPGRGASRSSGKVGTEKLGGVRCEHFL